MKRLDQLAAELEKVKAELAANRQKADAVEQRQQAAAPTATAAPAAPAAPAGPATASVAPTAPSAKPVPVPAPAPAPAVPTAVVTSPASPAGSTYPDIQAPEAPRTVFSAYGEINYNRPTRNASGAQLDVRRTVLGVEHRFDERTKVITELNPAPVPSSFYGWYGQAAYRLWKQGDYSLFPFARYERFNTAKTFAAVSAGLRVATAPDERVVTVGANLRVGSGVVLKADYQKFAEDKSRDRVNLGVGFSY